MKIKFDRRKIETNCIIISFSMVILITFLGILAAADGIFNWNILPQNLERIATLLMVTIGMLIGASFLLSVMINFSLISISLEKVAEKFSPVTEKDQKDE